MGYPSGQDGAGLPAASRQKIKLFLNKFKRVLGQDG